MATVSIVDLKIVAMHRKSGREWKNELDAQAYAKSIVREKDGMTDIRTVNGISNVMVEGEPMDIEFYISYTPNYQNGLTISTEVFARGMQSRNSDYIVSVVPRTLIHPE